MPRTSFDILDDCMACTPGSPSEARLRSLASQRPMCREAALILAFNHWYGAFYRADDPEMVSYSLEMGCRLEAKFGITTAFWAAAELRKWLELRPFDERLLESVAAQRKQGSTDE